MPRENLFNTEGYRDPTSHDAMQNIADEEERVNALIKTIKTVLRLAGFELIRRVEIRSLKTGREYR